MVFVFELGGIYEKVIILLNHIESVCFPFYYLVKNVCIMWSYKYLCTELWLNVVMEEERRKGNKNLSHTDARKKPPHSKKNNWEINQSK